MQYAQINGLGYLIRTFFKSAFDLRDLTRVYPLKHLNRIIRTTGTTSLLLISHRWGDCLVKRLTGSWGSPFPPTTLHFSNNQFTWTSPVDFLSFIRIISWFKSLTERFIKSLLTFVIEFKKSMTIGFGLTWSGFIYSYTKTEFLVCFFDKPSFLMRDETQKSE